MSAPHPREDRLPFSPAVGCGVAVLIGLLCAGIFFVALGFFQRGELTYAPEPYRSARLWLVRTDEGSGIGYSVTRPLRGETDDRVCAETAVRFLLTRRDASSPDVDFCECYERARGSWSSLGPCPE